MKSKLLSATVLAALATSLYATNGDHLIGLGAKSRGMGGVGIAVTHGAESALINPAMITSVKSTEISFGGTAFMPNVETNGIDSKADLSVIPEISIAANHGNGFYSGIGMWGTAGMGVDYRNTGATNSNMVTNLQLMQFGIPVAYKMENLSVGVTPILQYGALDISYTGDSVKGAAQDLGFGYNVGAAYNVSDFTFGVVYKSAIKMTYKGQISEAAGGFGLTGFSDDLEQPEEIGAGIAYVMGESTFGLDCKRINWSSAAGYKDFEWKDQDVYMLGYQYGKDTWALRVGYNYATTPIATASDPRIDMLNLMGFPATVESHYSVGGSYAFSKMMSLDGAYVYAPETTQTLGGVTTKHSQQSVSAQLTINF